jgi:hypothetical protein
MHTHTHTHTHTHRRTDAHTYTYMYINIFACSRRYTHVHIHEFTYRTLRHRASSPWGRARRQRKVPQTRWPKTPSHSRWITSIINWSVTSTLLGAQYPSSALSCRGMRMSPRTRYWRRYMRRSDGRQSKTWMTCLRTRIWRTTSSRSTDFGPHSRTRCRR